MEKKTQQRTIRRTSLPLNKGKWDDVSEMAGCYAGEKNIHLQAFADDRYFSECVSDPEITLWTPKERVKFILLDRFTADWKPPSGGDCSGQDFSPGSEKKTDEERNYQRQSHKIVGYKYRQLSIF